MTGQMFSTVYARTNKYFIINSISGRNNKFHYNYFKKVYNNYTPELASKYKHYLNLLNRLIINYYKEQIQSN